MNTPKIIISPFAERDQKSCESPLADKLPEIIANFHLAKPGYREGVVLIPIAPTGFRGQIRTLQDGDVFVGIFQRRTENEDPRKEIRVIGEPDPIAAVDVVLYHRDTLAEGNENSDLSADYEVITFLTKISEEDQPMPVGTLLANKFLDSGGTDTQMDDAQFVAALKKSHEFWKNRAIIHERPVQKTEMELLIEEIHATEADVGAWLHYQAMTPRGISAIEYAGKKLRPDDKTREQLLTIMRLRRNP